MNYTKEVNDFPTALGLTKRQVEVLNAAIGNAYHQHFHPSGPNIDQINAAVAKWIHTPEEAYYVATTVMSDVLMAMSRARESFIKP